MYKIYIGPNPRNHLIMDKYYSEITFIKLKINVIIKYKYYQFILSSCFMISLDVRYLILSYNFNIIHLLYVFVKK